MSNNRFEQGNRPERRTGNRIRSGYFGADSSADDFAAVQFATCRSGVFIRRGRTRPGIHAPMTERAAQEDVNMDKDDFGKLVDQSGLSLTNEQKSVLFEVYPLSQAMIARATPPMPREAEPAVIFMPEVR